MRIENEEGQPEKELSEIFRLSVPRILYSGDFRILCYLDPYGNTTFNAMMFDDLTADLKRLKERLPTDIAQIDDVLELVRECQGEVHTYLKFYGD